MYCSNCGNKIDENAYVCLNCGVIVHHNVVSQKVNNQKVKTDLGPVTGVLSIVFSSIALLFCLYGFVIGDISSVGMYPDSLDRIAFAVGYNFIQIFFAVIGLILSIIKIKEKCNKVGLFLSCAAFFLILTEFVVILIY